MHLNLDTCNYNLIVKSTCLKCFRKVLTNIIPNFIKKIYIKTFSGVQIFISNNKRIIKCTICSTLGKYIFVKQNYFLYEIVQNILHVLQRHILNIGWWFFRGTDHISFVFLVGLQDHIAILDQDFC